MSCKVASGKEASSIVEQGKLGDRWKRVNCWYRSPREAVNVTIV